MRVSILAVVGVLAASVAAAPFAGHVLHEKREAAPRQWVKRSKVDGRQLLPVRIGMTQSNLDKGYDMLMDVSKHDSPNFGKHYTAEEVHDIFAPIEETVSAIRGWLESAGIAAENITQSVNKQWMQFDLPTEELEALLQAEYHLFEHEPTGKTNIACDEYHVPAHVKSHIDYITPGIKLHAPGKTRASMDRIERRSSMKLPPKLKDLPMSIASIISDAGLSNCDRVMTPACIKALYNITTPTLSNPNNKLGIFEDLDDKYSQADLNSFFTTFASNIPIGTGPTLNAVDGATAPVSVLKAGAESDLDFQISYPIIYPQGTVLFQTDDNVYEANYTYDGFLNNFLDAIDGSYCTYSAYGETGNSPLDPPYPDPAAGGYKGALQCGVYEPTNVISISYGGQEADLPASYQQRQCNEYMKLGMQGVSVLVSSGDSGVSGPAGDDSANGCLGDGTIFSPDFPASCPFITALGATFLPTGANVNADAEVAVTRFPSGGGFSNIYPIPSYQSAAVSYYLTTYPPPYASYSSTNNDSFGAGGGIYNSNGRGYPDFGAVGDNVVIFNKGLPTLIGGTSASSPTFAAILTRINDERLAASKSTIGFVNPTLYANPQVLHDITNGSNPGCGTNGFSVQPGWDPVTGLGTPNYPAMLSLYMSMP